MINLCNRLIETSEEILLNYKANDNISLIEKQAKALEEKDKYISELEEKLKNYELSTKNIKVEVKEQIIGFSPPQLLRRTLYYGREVRRSSDHRRPPNALAYGR